MKDKKKIEIRIIFSFFKRFLRKLSPKIAFIIIDLITRLDKIIGSSSIYNNCGYKIKN